MSIFDTFFKRSKKMMSTATTTELDTTKLTDENAEVRAFFKIEYSSYEETPFEMNISIRERTKEKALVRLLDIIKGLQMLHETISIRND